MRERDGEKVNAKDKKHKSHAFIVVREKTEARGRWGFSVSTKERKKSRCLWSLAFAQVFLGFFPCSSFFFYLSAPGRTEIMKMLTGWRPPSSGLGLSLGDATLPSNR